MTDANRRPQAATADNNILVSEVAGGLNVTSSGLNTPLGDSTVMQNARVNEAGNVQTREGTQWLAELIDSSTIGFCGLSYTTKSGYNLVVVKDTVDIRIYQLTATQQDVVDDFELVMIKSDVWPAIAANIRFDYVVTNEPNSRIIFTTGIATPIQLQFFETSLTVTSGSQITTFSITGSQLEHAAVNNILVWVNGTRTAVNNVSYNSGTGAITVTFTTPLAAGTYFIDFAFVTWQWWAEAALHRGDTLYQSQTRFATDAAELSVSIPVDLTRTFDDIDVGAYNILLYQSTDKTDDYDYKSDRIPTLVSQFNFSQGINYVAAESAEIVPGLSHVTFGALPSNPEEVHFVKAEQLKFNGETGISAEDLVVFVDDSNTTIHTNPATPGGNDFGSACYLRNKEGITTTQFYSTLSVVTSTSTKARYISFDATEFIGLPANASVKMVNTNDNGFAGTGAAKRFNFRNNFRDGNAHPAYGMFEWADYLVGSFPRTCELFQGRLTFGGFPNKPLQVIFSNTFDSAVPGEFFNNYTVAGEDLESTDAIAVFLSSVQNDAAITGIITFAGSLFAFTRNKSIRLFSTTGTISPTSITSSVVASVGALNFACIELVDNSVIFLSSNGLYQLAPSLQVGDFTIRPASVKITSLLKNVNNANVAWISFNPSDNEILVAVTDNDSSLVANRLFYLSLFREAWAEYTLFYGRFNTSYGITVTANQVFTILSVPRATDAIGTTYDLISYPYFYPTDITKTATTELASVDFDLVVVEQVTYQKNLSVVPLNYKLIPLSSFQDLKVSSDVAGTLTFNKDYVKSAAGDVISLSTLRQVGAVLTHHPINEDGQYPVVIHKDNVVQTNYTLNVSTSAVSATINFANAAGTVKRYGYTYPAIVLSPLLVRQTISRPKSLTHLYVMLFNQQFLEVFALADVNVAQNQEIIELLGTWKREVGMRVAVRLDRGSRAYQSTQTAVDLTYDVGRYDIDSPAQQSAEYAKVAFALNGIANHMQVAFYSSAAKVWEVVAYELVTKYAKRTSFNSFD